MGRRCSSISPVLCGLLIVGSLHAADWTHYAGDAARSGIAPSAPTTLNRILWSATNRPDEEYVFHSSPVAHGSRVFVSARQFQNNVHVANLVIAYDACDGTRLWNTPIDPDVYDYGSWSSPAVDERNQTVMVAAGSTLFALYAASGQVAWTATLEREVINASPAISGDLLAGGSPANRAFITDFNGFGYAKLYGINVDPYDADHNPYQPGDIVWTAVLPGASGNSPAYADGTLYVASVGGEIHAYNALNGQPVWLAAPDLSSYPPYTGFYGGLTLRHGYLYAAAYSFYGGQNNSALFKLDAATGDVVWDVPCERTESIPIVTDDGCIYLSGGIAGFGSAVKIQAFLDQGNQATLLWDTYQDTGGALIVGGWTHQPVYADGRLYAGTPDGSLFFGPYTDLYVLNVARNPSDPDFIISHHAGSGGSPAAASGILFSFGQAGLFAFGRCPPDSSSDPTHVEPSEQDETTGS